MRRGQIFSLDALISLVIVIMIVGTFLSTSGELESGISGVIGWYSRSQIADTALGLLVKNPGTPPNWNENLSSLEVVGLGNSLYSYAVDYDKIKALVGYAPTNGKIVESLLNFTYRYSLLLKFFLPIPQIKIQITTSPLSVRVLNFTYIYDLSVPVYTLAIVNGSVASIAVANVSMASSDWVEVANSKHPLAMLKYNRSYSFVRTSTLTPLIIGDLRAPVPTYSKLRVNVTGVGYAVFAVRDGNEAKVLVVEKANQSSLVKAVVYNASGSALYTVNGTLYYVEIPWGYLYSVFDPTKGLKTVELWLYENSFTKVYISDNWGLDSLLQPKISPCEIKLWVWDEK